MVPPADHMSRTVMMGQSDLCLVRLSMVSDKHNKDLVMVESNQMYSR